MGASSGRAAGGAGSSGRTWLAGRVGRRGCAPAVLPNLGPLTASLRTFTRSNAPARSHPMAAGPSAIPAGTRDASQAPRRPRRPFAARRAQRKPLKPQGFLPMLLSLHNASYANFAMGARGSGGGFGDSAARPAHAKPCPDPWSSHSAPTSQPPASQPNQASKPRPAPRTAGNPASPRSVGAAIGYVRSARPHSV